VNDPFGCWNDDLLTDERPMSARFVPEDERVKSGWFGRDAARDCLDPDMDRTWLLEKLALLELDRFMVEAGGGTPVFVLMPPRVCARTNRQPFTLHSLSLTELYSK
jgi:hypothetical protein